MALRGFVVCPFWKRVCTPQGGQPCEADFEAIHRKLIIMPALDRAGISGDTTQQVLYTGNIHEDMFQLLAHADIVIADVLLHNANVSYEPGARHALRQRHPGAFELESVAGGFHRNTQPRHLGCSAPHRSTVREWKSGVATGEGRGVGGHQGSDSYGQLRTSRACKSLIALGGRVRCSAPTPPCHARGRGLKSCKPLLHSNERRLFGRVYDSAEMALGLAYGLVATALQGLQFPTKCDQRVRLDTA